jgi:tetratricopeptide (TPR) repeat protein
VADLTAALADAGVVEIDQLTDEILLADAEHFRTALPPISEILAGGTFGLRGDWIASSPEVLAAEELARDLGRGIREFELKPAEARVVVGAVWHARSLQNTLDGNGASGRGIPEPEDDEESIARWASAQLAELQSAVAGAPVRLLDIRHGLTDPWLAFATADEALNATEFLADGLELLCTTLLGSTAAPPTRAERASLEYLLGRCREHLGDPLAAERHFKASVAAEPNHSYALLGLAGIAADRGQYEAAQGLIERAGADEHHPLRTAVRIALDSPTAPARLPGRNDPCWCGSGRKFKVCHARVSSSPLPARARGLLGRAVAWLSLTQPGAIRELLEFGVAVGGSDCIETVASLVPDVLLFEGGALADYLGRRRDLIPDDEAMLAQQWLLRPRSLFEVEAVTAGQGMSLRDLMTGDRVDVVERTASTQLKAGELLLTRVASLGDHDEVFGGGTVVSIGERDGLLELLGDDPAPLDVVRFVARRYASPEIQTSGGDPLEFVEGTYTTTAPAQLRRALDARLDPAEEGSWNLLERGSGPSRRVLGSVELTGRTLTASAMSRARYAQLLEILDGIDVPLVERTREVRGMAQLRDEMPAPGPEADPGASSVLSPEDVAQSPELLAHLTGYIDGYERAWLDDSIPALGGVTPREAAADPTRRGDLIALLDSLPSTGSPLQMDGGRLKRALGLEE